MSGQGALQGGSEHGQLVADNAPDDVVIHGVVAVDDPVARGVARLREDLESGVWRQRFDYLRTIEMLDVGYRLVIADRKP